MKRRRLRGPQGPTGPVVLGLECGGDHLGVALLRLTEEPSQPPSRWRLLSEVMAHRGHRHADAILVTVDEALRQHDLEREALGLVAVGRGPGGFTGVRVGMATGLGLAMGLGVPTWQLDSLRVLAENAASTGGVAVPLIDARRDEVYGAAFRLDTGETLLPARVGPPAAVIEAARAAAGDEPLRVFGSGAVLHGCVEGAPEHWHLPAPRLVATLAALEWEAEGRPMVGAPLDPAYVRASDAELAEAR